VYFKKGHLYFTNSKFGEMSHDNGNWYIQISGVIHRKDSSVPWTREQMNGFWSKVCLLMRSYGVTNRFPLGPAITLKRDPDYRYKHIPTAGNHGLQVFGPVKKQKGCWDQEDCAKFREEVFILMTDQGLVLLFEPTIWCFTIPQDQEETDNTGSPIRQDGGSRVVVQ